MTIFCQVGFAGGRSIIAKVKEGRTYDDTLCVGDGGVLARDLSAEKRSAACSSVSDVKAMSPTYVRFANPYKVAGLSTRMRFRVASSHMC